MAMPTFTMRQLRLMVDRVDGSAHRSYNHLLAYGYIRRATHNIQWFFGANIYGS